MMIRPEVYLCTALSCLIGAAAFEWTSSSAIPSGSTRLACWGQNVSLPWQFQLSDSEHVIDVEWFYHGEGQELTSIASHVTGQFLTLPSMHGKLSFLPNAGLLLHNVTSDANGIYSVVINLQLHGSVISDTKTVRLEVSDDECSDRGAEIEMLKAQLRRESADNQALREQNANLSALIYEMQSTCYTSASTTRTTPGAASTMTTAAGLPESCDDIFRSHNSSGVYTIYPPNVPPLRVYCELDMDHFGWLVIQRRQDGKVNFYRNWTEYTNGFGDPSGEFWLGLAHIHSLTSSGNYSLRVDLTDWDNSVGLAIYDTFYISDESDNFRLHVGGYHGTAGDSLNSSSNYPYWIHNGRAFSTFDRRNDESSTENCAVRYNGAWWFNSCLASNLNGIYRVNYGGYDYQGIVWFEWHQDWRSYKTSEMKIRSN